MIDQDDSKFKRTFATCIVFQLYIPTVNCAVLRTAMVWGEDVSVYNTFSYFFWSGMT